MTSSEMWLVLGMALATFATRYPMLALVSKIELPAGLRSALKFIPPAVLTAIILPALLAPNGGPLDYGYTNPYWLAGLVCIVVAWRTHNLLLTLALGMLTFWGWRAVLLWIQP